MKRRKGNVLGTLVLDVGSSAIDRERKKRHTRIRVVQWDMGRSGYDNDEVGCVPLFKRKWAWKATYYNGNGEQ